jgi:hypothetical protein
MKKAVWSAAAALILMCSTSAQAQTTLATQDVTATVTVTNLARLTVGGPLSFPDTDPDSSASITVPAINVSAKARVAAAANILLTVISDKAHFDAPGSATIPVTGLTWTATGSAFINGTMSSAGAQMVASWTGPGNQAGTQTYTLANLWSYAPGAHSVTLTYTLSTP